VFHAGNASNFEVTTITTAQPFRLEQVSCIPPQELLSGDGHNDDTNVSCTQLQEIREPELDKMHDTCVVLIDKSRIIDEVLKLYEDEELIAKRLSVTFMDAHATGSGPQ
jgi:hypothetical protein